MLVAHTTLQHDHNPWYTSYIVTIQVIVDSTYNGEKKLHEEILFQIGEDKIFSPMRFSRIALRVDKSNVLLDSSTPEIIYVYYSMENNAFCGTYLLKDTCDLFNLFTNYTVSKRSLAARIPRISLAEYLKFMSIILIFAAAVAMLKKNRLELNPLRNVISQLFDKP
ncbi:hypothetical protein BDC45DRAFT_537849 [Circinella umbellata]|nr:hypothetical protein BDC45DRAFT_537849 [Circinella umbellata]